MERKMICPGCKVMISARSYPQHLNRKRCLEQHIKRDKLDVVTGKKKKEKKDA